MLAVLSFLAGLGIAAYGVARWFREREDALLAEIGQHYERRQQMMLGRIDEGDRTLVAAYADLDRMEHQKSLMEGRLQDVRIELDTALVAKAGVEQVLERRTAALATAEVQLERLRRAASDPESLRQERALEVASVDRVDAPHHGVHVKAAS